MSTKFLFMKKILSVFTLIACFTFLASTSSQAQVVRNATPCTFQVEVTYAKIGLCEPQGTINISIAPFTMVSLVIPPGHEIIESRGASQTSCAYNIGGACSTFPLVDNVSCAAPATVCDNYIAEWTAFGVWLRTP